MSRYGYLPNSEPLSTVGAKCYIVLRKICTNHGLIFSRGIILDEKSYLTVPLHDCNVAWKTKTYRGSNLTKISENFFTTNYSLKVGFKYCCYDYC